MAIYFLRHGQSEANAQRIFAGQQNDSALTDLGFEQAKLAGQDIKKFKIDRIIASNLIRAIQTASEVAKIIGYDVDNIEIDNRITEYDTGAITNTPIREISSEEFLGADGAEDVYEFRDRIVSALKQYKDYDENILLVSHAGVNKMIEALKTGIDLRNFHSLPDCSNASVFELDLNWLNLNCINLQ